MLGLSQDQPLDCWRNMAWGVKKGQRKEILPRHRVLRPNENHTVVPELSCPKRLGIRVSMIFCNGCQDDKFCVHYRPMQERSVAKRNCHNHDQFTITEDCLALPSVSKAAVRDLACC